MTLLNQKKAFTIIVLLLLSESAAALSTLPNITFYGRIIDQYSQPVIDASVWYETTNTYLSAGGGRGQVQTDEQGYFKIDSVGASLTIGTVTHPEISPVSYNPVEHANTFLPSRTSSVSFRSPEDNQGYPSWRDYTDKNKAYIVNAWRLGKYFAATKGSIRGAFNRTGDTYTLNLLGKNHKQIILEGVQKGHLRLSCTRQHMDNSIDFGDWAANITSINGGIQETNDLYMNLAPKTGYQTSLDIIMQKDSQYYTPSLGNKRYYFMSNDGKEYGSLFVNYEPHSKYEDDRFCIIDISYKINSMGLRNLELRKDDSGS